PPTRHALPDHEGDGSQGGRRGGRRGLRVAALDRGVDPRGAPWLSAKQPRRICSAPSTDLFAQRDAVASTETPASTRCAIPARECTYAIRQPRHWSDDTMSTRTRRFSGP